MAITIDTNLRIPATALETATTDPFSAAYTCGANAEVLVVMICYAGVTARTGADPTYNSIGMTRVESNQGVTETTVEMWYLLAPPVSASYNIVIQNDNGRTMWVYVVSFNAAADKSLAKDSSAVNATTAANPGVTITTVNDNAMIVAVVATGDNTFAPSARTGTSLYEEDIAAYGSAAQYYLLASHGAQLVSWTETTSDDYGAIACAFYETSGPVSTPKTFEGGGTPSGVLTKSTGKPLSGGMTPDGVFSRVVSVARSFAGGMIPAGPTGYHMSTAKTMRGTTTQAGLLTSVKLVILEFLGGLTPSGVLTKVANFVKGFDGGITPTGVLNRVFNLVRDFGGGITPTGVLTALKSYARDFAGGITPSGVLSNVLNIVREFTGGVTSAGVVVKQFVTQLVGTVGSSGIVTNVKNAGVTVMEFLGGITPTGVLTNAKATVREFLGGLTPSGTIVKSIGKLFEGGDTPGGVFSRVVSVARSFAGGLTPGGVLSIVKGWLKVFDGGITPGGAFSRVLNIVRTYEGGMTPSGVKAASLLRSFAGGITPSGILTKVRMIAVSLAGGLTPSGELVKGIGKALSGAITSAGVLGKSIWKTITGAVSSAGVLGNVHIPFGLSITVPFQRILAILRDLRILPIVNDNRVLMVEDDKRLVAIGEKGMTTTNTKTKTPGAILDYKFDWKPLTHGVAGADSDWLAVGETISSAVITILPSVLVTGLILDSQALTDTNTSVTVWLSSGTVGVDYTVKCKIVTNAARTDERTLNIRVRNL